MDKKVTMDKFYKHYPQFKTSLPDEEFSWLWYYSMQQMGDDESAVQSKELETKLNQRNEASHTIAQFIPTLHTQIQLNEIAKSDLGNQLLFMKKANEFHEKMRFYFYPKIFGNVDVKKENWSNFKIQTFEDTTKTKFIKTFYRWCCSICC